jgi:hypothetical protein
MAQTKEQLTITVLPQGNVETRVLVVTFPHESTDRITQHYQSVRNIPDTHVLHIPHDDINSRASWDHVFDDYVVPVQQKLDELGPKNIHYIVLVNPSRTIKYYEQNNGEKRVSTCSFTAVIYTLRKDLQYYNRNNPYWQKSYGNTFRKPWERFNHQRGIYHMVSALEGDLAIQQINNSVIEPTEGIDFVDSRYGNIMHIVDIDKYPDNRHYSYMDMDYKHCCLAKYFEEIGKTDYIWHNHGWTYGDVYGVKESKLKKLNDMLENASLYTQSQLDSAQRAYDKVKDIEEPPIKTKMWLGWYDGTYNDAWIWQPKSLWSQVHSGNRAAFDAVKAGCCFVTMPMFEPYTSGVCQPAEIGYYVVNGYTYGEAVLYSIPGFLWAYHCTGDPLTQREV